MLVPSTSLCNYLVAILFSKNIGKRYFTLFYYLLYYLHKTNKKANSRKIIFPFVSYLFNNSFITFLFIFFNLLYTLHKITSPARSGKTTFHFVSRILALLDKKFLQDLCIFCTPQVLLLCNRSLSRPLDKRSTILL
jgi:hypothetical protein